MLPRLRWSQTVQLFVSYYNIIRVQCGYANGYICEKQSIYYVSYYVKLYNNYYIPDTVLQWCGSQLYW